MHPLEARLPYCNGANHSVSEVLDWLPHRLLNPAFLTIFGVAFAFLCCLLGACGLAQALHQTFIRQVNMLSTELCLQVIQKQETSIEVVAAHFGDPVHVASQHLNVCPTLLKKICRQHGIKSWPFRQVHMRHVLLIVEKGMLLVFFH